MAGGRTFGALAWSNSQAWNIRRHEGRQPISNYAIKPTPELALRSNRTLPPARLIAALEFTWIPAAYRKKERHLQNHGKRLRQLEVEILNRLHSLYREKGFPEVAAISIIERVNTGAGRLVKLRHHGRCELLDGYYDLGGSYIEMAGLENGLMAVVSVVSGEIRGLEIAVYGDAAWNGRENLWHWA